MERSAANDAAARHEIRLQVHALNDLNQRIAEECYRKCVPNARDGDLSIGEMTCIDRCVPKYLATHDLVSKELTTIRNAVVAAPAASLPASAAMGTVSAKPGSSS